MNGEFNKDNEMSIEQSLISRKAIKDISLWFNERLVINLNIPFELKDKIIISKAKASEFKEWF